MPAGSRWCIASATCQATVIPFSVSSNVQLRHVPLLQLPRGLIPASYVNRSERDYALYRLLLLLLLLTVNFPLETSPKPTERWNLVGYDNQAPPCLPIRHAVLCSETSGNSRCIALLGH